MPSGPTLFDDEDGLDPHRESVPRESPIDERHDDPPGARRGGPNYLIRRSIVVGGVVAVLATASIVVGQLIGSGADDTVSGVIGTDWNRIVLVDDRTGRVIVDDGSGEEVARLESGIRTPTDSAIVGSTLVVAGADSVAVIDVGSEEVDDYELGAGAIEGPSGSDLTLITPQPDGARALIVHGPSGDVIDTDTFAPVVGERYEFADARSSTSGRDLLVTDSGNFQSVLFSFDRDEPSFFPGLALAVDSDLVVTAQNVGSDATVNVFDHTGEPISTGRTSSVRAGIIGDAGVVLVTVEGAVVTMSPSNGETSDGAQLDIGTVESGIVTPSGDRLIVTGTTGTAIVGGTGEVVASFDEKRPADSEQSPAGSTCVSTITAGNAAEAEVAVVDITDGSILVEADGTEPLLADASGCIIGTSTSAGFDLLSRDGVQRYRTGETLQALSLDGLTAAVVREGRIIMLDTAAGADSTGDPIDLGPQGRTVHFTQS